jgi:putative oxidoreductase
VSLLGLAGVLELFVGALILVGLFTRPVAFVLSGFMAVAYFMAHASKGFLPILNHGELAVAYCFVFLLLAAAGGGEWSLDRLLRSSRVAVLPLPHPEVIAERPPRNAWFQASLGGIRWRSR